MDRWGPPRIMPDDDDIDGYRMMNDSDHWPANDEAIATDEDLELPRRYLTTVAIELAFTFKVEAENRAIAVDEAIALAKTAKYQLAGESAHSVEIRGCGAIAL